MIDFVRMLIQNKMTKVLVIFIALDTVFGVLRAIKERNINSSIGIDGIIRKCGMLISIFFLYAVDYIIMIDLIGFIPEEMKQVLNINNVGIGDLFNLIFIVFEILSVLKNMIKCQLPIPKRLQSALEKVMVEFTGEINKYGQDKYIYRDTDSIKIKEG